jgi:hypothetical protein
MGDGKDVKGAFSCTPYLAAEQSSLSFRHYMMSTSKSVMKRRGKKIDIEI